MRRLQPVPVVSVEVAVAGVAAGAVVASICVKSVVRGAAVVASGVIWSAVEASPATSPEPPFEMGTHCSSKHKY
jgi:hypothetical protein